MAPLLCVSELILIYGILLLDGHKLCLHFEKLVLELGELSLFLLVGTNELLGVFEGGYRKRHRTSYTFWRWNDFVVLHKAFHLLMRLTFILVIVERRWNWFLLVDLLFIYQVWLSTLLMRSHVHLFQVLVFVSCHCLFSKGVFNWHDFFVFLEVIWDVHRTSVVEIYFVGCNVYALSWAYVWRGHPATFSWLRWRIDWFFHDLRSTLLILIHCSSFTFEVLFIELKFWNNRNTHRVIIHF